MVMKNFGKKIQANDEKTQHALERTQFFKFWVMGAGRNFSPDVPKCFCQVPKRFQRALQVPKLYPIAP
jgi:hypothetical protein